MRHSGCELQVTVSDGATRVFPGDEIVYDVLGEAGAPCNGALLIVVVKECDASHALSRGVGGTDDRGCSRKKFGDARRAIVQGHS